MASPEVKRAQTTQPIEVSRANAAANHEGTNTCQIAGGDVRAWLPLQGRRDSLLHPVAPGTDGDGLPAAVLAKEVDFPRYSKSHFTWQPRVRVNRKGHLAIAHAGGTSGNRQTKIECLDRPPTSGGCCDGNRIRAAFCSYVSRRRQVVLASSGAGPKVGHCGRGVVEASRSIGRPIPSGSGCVSGNAQRPSRAVGVEVAWIREPQQVEIGVHHGSIARTVMAEKVTVAVWIRRVAAVVASFVPETHVVAKLMRERLRRSDAEAVALGTGIGRIANGPRNASTRRSPQQDQVGGIEISQVVNFV